MTDLDTLVNVLAEGKSTEESTGEHVTSTVGVDNLVVGQLGHGVRLWVLVLGLDVGRHGGWLRRGDERRVGTLGDDNQSRLRGVRL